MFLDLVESVHNSHPKTGTLYRIPVGALKEADYINLPEFAFSFAGFIFFTDRATAARLGGSDEVQEIFSV